MNHAPSLTADGLSKVGEVQEFFEKACYLASAPSSGEWLDYREFLEWFDDTPREVMRS